jgi:nucleoside-diphosphate-sugar epimerase
MTVLVTGASGFLGGALARALAEQGKDVRVLMRTTSNFDHLKDLDLDVVYGDVTDRESLSAAFRDLTIAYHCAALSADWGPWEVFRQVNVGGTRNMLEAARDQKKLKRFLHVSTTDVYGYPPHPCDESYPITDIGLPYNKTKVISEGIVWEFHKETGLPVTVVRPAAIYGPRSESFIVEIGKLLLKKQMLYINRGQTPAGLLYVDNAVDGIIRASESPNTIGQAYNLRDETSETWQEFLEAFAEELGTPPPKISMPSGIALGLAYLMEGTYRVFRIKNRPLLTRHAVQLLYKKSFSIDKARKDFDFDSKVSFAEGIKRSADWFKSHYGGHRA